MKLSEMTGQDRLVIFGDPEHYPLLITVDETERALEKTDVDRLRLAGVDFEVDEKQATLILIKKGTC